MTGAAAAGGGCAGAGTGPGAGAPPPTGGARGAYGAPRNWSAMRPASRSPLRKAPCTVAGYCRIVCSPAKKRRGITPAAGGCPGGLDGMGTDMTSKSEPEQEQSVRMHTDSSTQTRVSQTRSKLERTAALSANRRTCFHQRTNTTRRISIPLY